GEETLLRRAGFVEDPLGEAEQDMVLFHHPAAMLPRVLLSQNEADTSIAVAVRVENLMDFMAVHAISAEPEGDPLSHFRRVAISVENGARLEAVERRGYRGFMPGRMQAGEVEALLKARELWQTRPRTFDRAEEGYRAAHARLDRIIDLIGRDLACHVVFEGERAYWQRRNRAAQLQKERQDKLG